ncbi:ABC transporter permease [Propionibacteriaceae bacterium Y2011]
MATLQEDAVVATTDPAPTIPPGDHTPGHWAMGWRRFKRDRFLVLIGLPGMVLLLVFQYLPLLGTIIAFKDYQPYIGILDSPWVGLENFRVIFNGDPLLMNALKNTLIISLIQIVIAFPVPIALALLLNSLLSENIKRVVQSVLYLPHFLSWVVIVAIFQHLLGSAGLVNTGLRDLGLPTLQLIGNPDLFIPLISAQVIWKDAGWGTIIFLAALSRVDASLYEAASVDGASRMRQMWHVTLPAIRGVAVLLLILRLGDALTVGFEQIILQQPAVGLVASEVLDTYVYNNGIIGGAWGVATAVGLVKAAVGIILILGANRLAHAMGESGLYTRG